MTAFVPSTQEKDLSKVILSVQQLAAGRSNAVGTVTLSTGTSTVISTTTTLTQSGLIAPGSNVHLTATSSGAAAELATLWVSAVAKDSLTITHSGSTAVRTFMWSVQG